jgi:16S rRNA A1518/A1519 N6-dimethyltransferase RsmA/KsgA/DIM1 with predicted DNA glycosylase/AP lyase activity
MERGFDYDTFHGQHILENQEILDEIVREVPPHRTVVEVGAGPGNLTERLASKSRWVIAIERDERFEPHLRRVQRQQGNLEVVINDALRRTEPGEFEKLIERDEPTWVAGNIPFHITEPLIRRLADLPIEGATFLVGARFASEVEAETGSPDFGTLTQFVNTFFRPRVSRFVGKENFSPQPRTSGAVLTLERREEIDFRQDKPRFLWREMFESARFGTLVKNALRKGLIKFAESDQDGRGKTMANRHQRREVNQRLNDIVNRDKWKDLVEEGNRMGVNPDAKRERPFLTKNEARMQIASCDLPDRLLNKTVEQLTNRDVVILNRAIESLSQ